MSETHLLRLPSGKILSIVVGGFFLLTLLIYGASLSNSFVRWDDGLLIYENPAIRGITPNTVKKIFTMYDPELYIPLTFLSYQIDYVIGGTNPVIYHVQNLLFHTFNALLVAWITLLFTKNRFSALLCGVLFAVHPLHAEAVAWASARKDVLSTFFFLGSIIAYLAYRHGGRKKAFLLSIAAFLLGLLAKVTVLTLPVVLLLADFRERRKWEWRVLLEKLPYFALTAVFGVIAWYGKTGVLSSSATWEKILMAPKSAMFYLEKIFLPWGFSVLYPFTGDVTLARTDILIPFLLLILLAVLTFASLRWTREIFFGVGFFFITVSPTLFNFAKGDFYYFASDRYAYVPSIGIFLLLSLGLQRLLKSDEIRSALYSVLAAIAVLVLAVLSSFQSLVWRDSVTLFSHVLSLYPLSYVALNNLGNVYRYAGDEAKAAESYVQALSVIEQYGRKGPDLPRAQSKTLSNLASAERQQGDLEGAKGHYERALSLNPDNEYAHLGMGIIAGQEGRIDDAETQYRTTIALSPAFATPHVNLGALLVNTGKVEEGIKEYMSALELNPFYPQAHFNLGVAYAKLGKTEEATTAYRETVRLEPRFTAARINLGITLFNRGDIEGAKKEFEAILVYDPQNAQARVALQQIAGRR